MKTQCNKDMERYNELNSKVSWQLPGDRSPEFLNQFGVLRQHYARLNSYFFRGSSSLCWTFSVKSDGVAMVFIRAHPDAHLLHNKLYLQDSAFPVLFPEESQPGTSQAVRERHAGYLTSKSARSHNICLQKRSMMLRKV